MNGIEKCEMFRAMRKRLCEDNGIPFIEEDCPTPNENCIGTCANCDYWLKKIGEDLAIKQQRGEKIYFDGMSEIYNSYLENGGEELIVPLPDSPLMGQVIDPEVPEKEEKAYRNLLSDIHGK